MDINPLEELALHSNFKITSADADMEARLRIGALCNYLIQSAINSADKLGFGYGGIRQQNLFWVLSRLTIEILKPFGWSEKIDVETWPKDIDGIFYLRDFLIRDESQSIITRATSGWLAIDIETKRPKKVDAIHAEMFIHLKNKHALEQLPEKLNSLSSGDSFDINSTFYDLDLNKHVTSTRYIDWMIDSFPYDFIRENYPKSLTVNFIKETMLGDKIRIIRNQSAYNEFQFEGTNITKNTTAFRGKICF